MLTNFKTKVTFYRDSQNKHRIRVTSLNGRIIFSSSEGYSRKRFALENLQILKDSLNEYFTTKTD